MDEENCMRLAQIKSWNWDTLVFPVASFLLLQYSTPVLLTKEQVFNFEKNKVQRATKETEQTQAEAYVRRWYFWHYKY